MYIVIKTDEPDKIKITTDGKQKLNYFYTDTLDLKNNRSKKTKITQDATVESEFNNYIKSKILEPNELSADEMKMLALEYQRWLKYLPEKSVKYHIGSEIQALALGPDTDLKNYWELLVNVVDKYVQPKHNIKPWEIKDFDINPVKDLDLKFPFRINKLYHQSACGAFNMRFYKFIYYFDFLGIKIENPMLKEFWNFYKRTLDVYAMGLQKYSYEEKICILPKPADIFQRDGITHCIYDYNYYCDGIIVPKWLYSAKKSDLNIDDFCEIENVDIRSIFIKKAGIEKFIGLGKVIDSWENYPDNEWWKKSEYKLIDMKSLLINKRYVWNGKTSRYTRFEYAPFLCMKNQTTGEYHLEGVSPDCINLYDALKMRYKGLNLPVYDVKDVK